MANRALATTVARLGVTVGLAVGALGAVSAPAHAASTPAAGAQMPVAASESVSAAPGCGLNRWRQWYTNCRNHSRLVAIAFIDSAPPAGGGSVVKCVSPGRHAIINLIGPFRLAITAHDRYGRC